MTDDELAEVRILDLPVALWAKTQEHADDLMREFALIAEAQQQEGRAHEVPSRLLALVDELIPQYAGFSGEQEQALADAAAAHQPSIDLVYHLPATVADAAQHLGDLFDEADTYCLAGQHLLTLATPEPLVRFRHWFLQEFVEQARTGAAPTPWPQWQGS